MRKTGTSKNLINVLKEKEQTIAIAESVTGGYTTYLLTKTPGASAVVKMAIVVYSLFAKEKMLGLPKKHLTRTDGVSPQTAKLLATKVRNKAKSSLGAAIVGYAGPTAPKGKKGTVHMAVTTGKRTVVKSQNFHGSRDQIRKKSARILITLIGKIVGI